MRHIRAPFFLRLVDLHPIFTFLPPRLISPLLSAVVYFPLFPFTPSAHSKTRSYKTSILVRHDLSEEKKRLFMIRLVDGDAADQSV